MVFWGRPSDVEAFERHYCDVHIPLTKRLPGLRRYTLNRNPIPVRGDNQCYAVAELDWDDLESANQAFRSEAGEAVARDVANLAKWNPDVRSAIYEVHDVDVPDFSSHDS